MLAAGGTKHYSELLKPFGLDAKDPKFWDGGLSVIAGMIDELEGMGLTGRFRGVKHLLNEVKGCVILMYNAPFGVIRELWMRDVRRIDRENRDQEDRQFRRFASAA